MKLLFIHADEFSYEAKKKTPVAEDIPDEMKSGRVAEVLVAFCAVEKIDEGHEEATAARAVEEAMKILDDVKAQRVMVYPYAHLSSSLSSPKPAVVVLKRMEAILAEKGVEVNRSPFGWYKAFDISCKGHPLSELSREIRIADEAATAGGEDSKPEAPVIETTEAAEKEKSLKSSWYVLTPEGEVTDAKDFKFNKDSFKKFYDHETKKDRAAKGEPPHVKLMQKLELVDYEPASDPGHFRFFPKGKLVKTLLERYVNKRVRDTGGMEIETPIMYDYEHPSLKSYLNRFPARQYAIQTPNKKVFLRFAACFGQFLMMHDATVSYRDLPLRLYELTRYSFRVEQRGELAGLRRLRAFTMPDCHSFCADMEMAKAEIESRFQLSHDILTDIGFDLPGELEFAIRATRDFFEENKGFLAGLAKKWGRPALVEVWDDRFFYFVFKYEWNFVDALGKASALNTDQIDVENAERYDITYVGSDGKEHHPLILHQSPSGAIERVIYALLERAHLQQMKGVKPAFPLWLSPTQVRLIPIGDEFLDDCKQMAAGMPGIRVDIDDRDEKVGKKIRAAEKDWTPMIVVYGAKEKESGTLPVRMRSGELKDFTLDELKNHVAEAIKAYPFEDLALPLLLSARPVFRG